MKPTNEQGFSLVEVILSMGMLTFMLLSLADTATRHAMEQATARSDSEVTSLFNQVQGIAGAEWSCTAGLAGSDYRSAIVVKDPVNLTPIAAEGTTGNDKFWSLTRARLQDVQDVPGQPGVLRASLFLEATKSLLNTGSPIATRVIPDIYFEINPNGTIARCYTTSDTVAAGQSACQLLGGTWNPSAPTGGQCQLPSLGG